MMPSILRTQLKRLPQKEVWIICQEKDLRREEPLSMQVSPQTLKEVNSLSTISEEEDQEEYSNEQESHTVLMSINQSYVDLTLKSNGKADLYFAAYIWYTYLMNVFLQKDHSMEEKDFETEIVKNRVEVARLKGLAESLKRVAANISKFPFNKEQYEKFVNDFGGKKQIKKIKLLEELQRSLFVAQLAHDEDSLHWIEKLLVQLLGYYEMGVRDQSVVLLNMLYDGIDWQLQSAFRPVIRCIGQHFKVHTIVDYEMDKNKQSQLFLGLSAPYPIEGFNKQILTWHKIDMRNIVKSQGCETEIAINFGKFWKCGFYDWKLVAINDNGRLQPLEIIGEPEKVFPHFKSPSKQDELDEEENVGTLAQGRFIVQAKGLKDQNFHEICVDYQDAEVDTEHNKFIKRGNFKTIEQSIPTYKKKGISALYLMGVLERDNYPVVDKSSGEVEFKKADASALAVTSRETPNIMLGGSEGFKRVVAQAKASKMKIVVDCLSRISSSRHHRKYKDLLLYYLDEGGKRNICYGTDGQSIDYEDTAILNYRKIESWNLLIDEVITLADNYGIDGIHLDNGQAWPQIMEANIEELMRLDVDGVCPYTPMDLLNGEIVIRNENNGYWNTNMMEKYPNPFFVKMCKKLWEKQPNFMVIGECWGGYMFENRQIIMSRSGVIPRMFKLPQTICQIFGKNLLKDGQIKPCEKKNVLALKEWYETSRQFVPEGTIMLQSSSAHCWPYPAYLYGKATWAVVDIMYFMPDIPITFMGEINGEVYRIGQTQVFQHLQEPNKTGGLKRSNSQVMMALNKIDDEFKEDIQKSEDKNKDRLDAGASGEKNKMHRVTSGSNLSALKVEQITGQDLKQKELKFKAEIGPLQGFDLNKIHTHYEHRRKLRRDKMVLRYGQLVPLVARHATGWHSHVLAYARHSLMETAIIATNLTAIPVQFWIDLTELAKLYTKTYSTSTVVMIQDWLRPDSKPEYYFLEEFLNQKQLITLEPYHSTLSSVSVCEDEQYVLKKTMQSSIERTRSKLQKRENIESEQISLIITDILLKEYQDVRKFANVIGTLQENFLEPLQLNFYDLIINNLKLKTETLLSSRLIGLSQIIVKNSEGQNLTNFAPLDAAKSIIDGNKLGPIVFCTPELGRWSTVGGLGVMVDELSVGLATQFGQEVWVISPYYDKNKKGETGYLEKDPAGISYSEVITAKIEGGYTLGVHEGIVNKVKVIFLHNSVIFPAPYIDCPPAEQMRQMAVFAKGCLEFCCKRQVIPSVCVTNDWFTALVPAYAKHGAFGDTFRGTTFFHIAHNLEQTYEGRLFPQPHQGALEFVHSLPRECFVDPYWDTKKLVVNPSRCAIMLSDQWGTVSQSYKEDLLKDSPLRGLLKQKNDAFAYPNGIPIEERLKKLDAAAPDHLSAKRIIQKKYFNYQDLDDTVPLLSFVGRITLQKGVHLILDAAEHLINHHGGKINILVGGAVNLKEPYSAACAQKMWALKAKYPNNFWADPNAFFYDGSLVNRGSDYGLMPSIFEPGGIVQHEFFVGGTPVVAFKTGGLKDSVFEYKWDSEEGNGYSFEFHGVNDFIFACDRAIGTFHNKPKYLKLRQNAFNSTMDGEKVCRAWLTEFYRLRGKIYVEEKIIQETIASLNQWSPSQYKPIESFEELFGLSQKLNIKGEDIDHGAEEEKDPELEKTPSAKVYSSFERSDSDANSHEKYPHLFMMHNQGPRHSQVQLIGSFDNWQTKHNMTFANDVNQWYIALHLNKGKYLYKYIINGSQWVINEQEPKEKDASGNLNNVALL